jgi:hypothetical protein
MAGTYCGEPGCLETEGVEPVAHPEKGTVYVCEDCRPADAPVVEQSDASQAAGFAPATVFQYDGDAEQARLVGWSS